MSQNTDSLVKRLNASSVKDTNRVNLIVSIATVYEKSGEYENAILLCREGLALSKELKFKLGEQACSNILGNCFLDKGELKTALEFHLSTLKLRVEMKNEKWIGYSNLNLGNIYLRLDEFKNAIACYTICKEITEKQHDEKVLAICLTSLGSVYGNMREAQKAEKYFLDALVLQMKSNDESGMSDTYSNLSVLMMDAKNYKESLKYAFKSLDLLKRSDNKLSVAIAKSNIGDVYCQMKEYKLSIKFQEEALQLSNEMGSLEMIKICSQLLSVAYNEKGDDKNALFYYEQYSNASDSLTNQESNKSISEMKTRFETDKKQKEIELLQKDLSIRNLQLSEQESNIHRQRIIIGSVVIGIALVIALLLFILKNGKEKKRINIGLERKNIEIQIQKNKIEEKNMQITDSIDYAKSIQSAILPEQKILDSVFVEHFIVYKPKELVSGDFYWCYQAKNKLYLSVLDCKLQGVPGAFMTVMVYNILEEIMHAGTCTLPSEIINQLNKSITTSLFKKNESVFKEYFIEGLIICVDEKNNELLYSGANTSFYLRNEAEFSECTTGTQHIGDEQTVFSDTRLQIKNSITMYLFTDGVKSKADFKEVIQALSFKSLKTQGEILNQEFLSNQGDDICVFAVKLK